MVLPLWTSHLSTSSEWLWSESAVLNTLVSLAQRHPFHFPSNPFPMQTELKWQQHQTTNHAITAWPVSQRPTVLIHPNPLLCAGSPTSSPGLFTSCRRECINLGCNTDIDLSGPTTSGWAALGYADWLAGCQMASERAKSKLSQNNSALGYKAGDFQLHLNVNDGTEFGGSVYQKVNNEAETSVSLAWTAGSSKTCFGIAAELPRATSSLALNNGSLTGIGDTLALQPGVKLTLRLD
uniref:Non-selective voltage-gated ion channel VDAC3 n=1 Tax=Coturnix japonica TaxID=93934 RepID=A0A8C2SSH1_COTJA